MTKMNGTGYPDIESEAIAIMAELTRKASMYDRFVRHIVEDKVLMTREEYEMIGLGDKADELFLAGMDRLINSYAGDNDE